MPSYTGSTPDLPSYFSFQTYMVRYYTNRYNANLPVAYIDLFDSGYYRVATLGFWFGETAHTEPLIRYDDGMGRYYMEAYFHISEFPVIIDLLRNKTVNMIMRPSEESGSAYLSSKAEPVEGGERRSFFPFPRPSAN
jgi:hypothetical protein